MVIYEGHRSVKGEYLYNQVDKNLNFQKHTHCNYEIVFCLGGCLVCEVGNTKYELHNGEGMLILPGLLHARGERGLSLRFFNRPCFPVLRENKDEVVFKHAVFVRRQRRH